MDVSTLKKQFSMALFSVPGNAFKAACVVFPDDISMACRYAVEWNNDPEVISEIERLKFESSKTKEEVDLSIPSKEDALRLAWEIADSNYEQGKDRVAALKLFAEIAGHMPDKTVNKNVNMSGTVNKVMIIKDHGTDEEWEEKALTQQRILANAE